MSGKHESSTLTLHPDGQEHPVSPQAPSVVVITTFVGPRMLETRAKKDGKTLTATVRGTDGAGKPFAQIIVFDREAN